MVELDVCLSGLGGWWENLVYHLPLPHNYGNLGIAQLEMINILVAIHVFASGAVDPSRNLTPSDIKVSKKFMNVTIK